MRPADPADEFDVVVVGMGAAGHAAAIEARDRGARVVMVEKASEEHAGGQTRVSGATWFDNRDPAAAAEYLRALCHGRPLPEPLIAAWVEETTTITSWVEGLGAAVNRMDMPAGHPELPGHECFGGLLHVGDTWGNGHLFRALQAAARRRGIGLLYRTRAVRLVQDGAGRVCGVEVEQDGRTRSLGARQGVVLATGGFQANEEMVRDHLGLPGAQQWGSPYNTGDGHRMAMAVGADLWHMHNHFPLLGIRTEEYPAAMAVSFPSDGLIFVGQDGKRFIDESVRRGHGHGMVRGAPQLFPHEPMWVVFDERTRTSGPFAFPFDTSPFGWNRLVEGYRWSEDNSAEIDKGWILRADTPEDLATRMGVDPAALARTLDRYNGACRSGVDDLHERDAATLVPVERPPFYAFAWGPVINFTCGGPRRNERAQVLDPAGEPIDGLYCAGEMSSTFPFDFDSGMPIADALVIGRTAGRCVGVMPGGAMPGGAMPGGAMPGGAMPGGAMPGGAMPGEEPSRAG